MLTGLKGKERALNPGFVLANDADNHWATILSKQSSWFNSASIAIINHNAANLPNLHYQPGTDSFNDAFSKLDFDNWV